MRPQLDQNRVVAFHSVPLCISHMQQTTCPCRVLSFRLDPDGCRHRGREWRGFFRTAMRNLAHRSCRPLTANRAVPKWARAWLSKRQRKWGLHVTPLLRRQISSYSVCRLALFGYRRFGLGRLGGFLDLHAADTRFHFRRLHRDFQHTVVECRRHLFGIDTFRQR